MNVNARYALNVIPVHGRDFLDAMAKVGWSARIMGRIGNGDGEGQLKVIVDVPATKEDEARIKFGALKRDGMVSDFERTTQWRFT